MDYLNFNFNEIKILKAFFKKFDEVKTLRSIASLLVPGMPKEVTKTEYMKLLQRFPSLKDQNDEYIAKFLSDPKKKESLLGELPTDQRVEIEQVIAEKPIPTSTESQPTGQEAADQVAPASGHGDFSSGNIPFTGMSSQSAGHATRLIHNIPHAPASGMEGGTGSGTAASLKGAPSGMEKGTGTGRAATNKPNTNPGMEGGTGIGSSTAGKLHTSPTAKPETTSFAPKQSGASTRFNAPAFKSSVSNFTKQAQNYISPAKLPLNRGINQVAKSLGGIAKNTGSSLLGAAGGSLGKAVPHLGRLGQHTAGALQRISTPGIGKGGKLSKASNKAALGLIGGLLFIVLLGGLFGGLAGGPSGTTPTGTAPGGISPIGTSDISSCKFTRAGDSQPIKSSILAGWISQAAQTAGIPAPILASVAMHENPDFVKNADNNHDGIKTNQLCNKGKVFCEQYGQVLHSKEGENDPCSTNELASGARNAQAVGLMQIIDIFNPGKDLCSITESLNIAATKLKNDGLTSQPTQDQINAAIDSYYNSCDYGGYSYCNEAWNDYQNCQTQGQPVIPPVGGKTDIKFYCESDPAWQNVCGINYYGCGPTSMAIVVSSLGITKNPLEVDQMFRDTGARSCGDYGSTLSLFLTNSTWFKDNFVYQYLPLNSDGSLDLTQAKQFLDNEYLIIGSSHQFPCPSPGWCGPTTLQVGVVDHIFAVDAVNVEQNLVHVQDPANCRPEHISQYDTNAWISNQLISLIVGSQEYNKPHPWYFAVAIKNIKDL